MAGDVLCLAQESFYHGPLDHPVVQYKLYTKKPGIDYPFTCSFQAFLPMIQWLDSHEPRHPLVTVTGDITEKTLLTSLLHSKRYWTPGRWAHFSLSSPNFKFCMPGSHSDLSNARRSADYLILIILYLQFSKSFWPQRMLSGRAKQICVLDNIVYIGKSV